MFRFEICLPVSLKGKYHQRFKAFQRHGLLNQHHLPIRLVLLTGPEDSSETLLQGWSLSPQSHIEIRRYPVPDPGGKLARYYHEIKAEDLSGSDWFIRVDDDSVTNLGGIHQYLEDNANPDEAHHFITKEACWQLDAEILEVLLEVGGKRLLTPGFSLPLDYEMSLTSREAMRRVSTHNQSQFFLDKSIGLPPVHGDQFLPVACQLAGVFPSQTLFLCCYADVEGLMKREQFHIHYVAPDIQGYDLFIEQLEAEPFGPISV